MASDRDDALRVGRGPRPRPSRGRSDGKRPGPAMADGRLFSVGGQARLYIAKQNSRPPPSSAALRPLSLRSAVQVRSARRLVIATKAAMGAANPTRDITMATDCDDHDFEPTHHRFSFNRSCSRPTAVYGHRPFQDGTCSTAYPKPNHYWRRRRHLRRVGIDTRGHAPRTGSRGPALVDRQPFHRGIDASNATRRQRTGAARSQKSRMARRCARWNLNAYRRRIR